jgi:ribonuclease Z
MIGFELVNGSAGDPCVYIHVPSTRENAMLDCGLNVSVPVGKLLRVADVFISHTHIDHMIGFDWVVRANLTHDKVLHVYGPEPLTEQVRSRLRGYTWNLDTRGWVTIACHEIGGDAITTTVLPCETWFDPVEPPQTQPLEENLIPHARLQVRFARLEHRVVSLAYSLQAPPRMNVDAEAVAAAGLSPGPWLRELKRRTAEALRSSQHDGPPQVAVPDDDTIEVDGRALPTQQLIRELLTVRDGFKLVYVTDTIYAPETRERIVELARKADVLLCEAVFSAQDADTARSTYHLTARQAGELAADAQVAELVLFHFSGRYADDYGALVREAQEQFPRVRAYGIE